MAEKFAPLAAGRLLSWILEEEKRGQVFGIHRELFFRPRANDPFRMRRFGRLLETPLGVAAGPHTQLAQNIVAAWLCGARFIELKTVQTLDRLDVRKPCIAVSGAGFNCEWSQELTLEESFDQYLAAWVLLHVLRHRLKGSLHGDPGFVLNFSVGYDLAGIMQPNMQRFFDRISFCRAEKEALLLELAPLFPAIRDIDIPECISDSVTLSTMHGCPPDEIERIAVQEAIRYEESRGWVVESVEKDNRGFDLISRRMHAEDPQTAVDVRFIEVKGRAGIGEVLLSDNEFKTAQRLSNDYWL